MPRALEATPNLVPLWRGGKRMQRDLAQIQYFFLDMDGTLYLGDRLLPGATDLIAYLQRSGRRYLFFTNNPTRSPAAYAEKLTRLGIHATAEQVLTSGEVMIRFLKRHTVYTRLYVIGTPSFESELRRAGFTLSREDPQAVILAFDTTLTYEKLVGATHWLRGGLPYYATNPDKVCPTEDGFIPDCGATAALLEAATGRTPKYVGKPYAEMVEAGLEKLGADPGRTAIVGDRLYTDMAMGFAAGITPILLLSGETRPGDLEGADLHPPFVFPSAAELTQALQHADIR